ncbi:SF1_C_UvrD domain containing protein [Candidatus Nanopelagicaceae bacterium]
MQPLPEVIRIWSGSHWEIALEQESLSIKSDEKVKRIPCDGSVKLETKRRWFKWHLLEENQPLLRLKGLSRIEAKLLEVSFDLSQTRAWSKKLQKVLFDHQSQQRWIPQEVIDELIESKPLFRGEKTIQRFGLTVQLSEQELQAIHDSNVNLNSMFETLNQEILFAELNSQKEFLESIENKPLSLEQSTAVVTFDNRVLLVAAAGSGKTSVMVARAAYATMKKFIDPSRILLLAFNKAAAEELQGRIRDRFESAHIDSTGIRASTFHAFGLDVIGRGLNARPTVATWVDSGRDIEEVADIVKSLKETSEDFKYKWDLYRLIFPPETMKVTGVDYDAYDSDSKEQGFRTFDGKIVRSHGERMIADWLYLNGVSYQYEREYTFRTADLSHRQYKPDFYYPEIDTWHEHWALDRNGNPPDEFTGYLDSMSWKRNQHSKNGTQLIETTFAEVVFANGLDVLKEKLSKEGIKLTWDPDRPKAPYTNIEDEEIIRLVRAFMTHVKSNSLTSKDLQSRLFAKWSYLKSNRTDLFLEIFWQIYDGWNQRLRDSHAIDFEDMLVQAAETIENDLYLPDYDLILVDEFQDSSSARARLLKSLLKLKGKYVLVVGDDWQSVNRFAGADVSLMKSFHDSFGNGPTLYLSRTYRCTQAIVDTATKFVTKNPMQMLKNVLADQGVTGNPIVLLRAGSEQQGVREALTKISDDVKTSGQKKSSIFVLGRYKHNRDWIPNVNFPNLDIKYRTIHGSKGLEADYVVVVNMEAGRHGFPSEIEDDPILNLAMSELEEFEHAEERRLLYVALTRARKQAFLVTRQNRDSMFAVELMSDALIEVVTLAIDNSDNSPVLLCPDCKKGVMVIKKGPYGQFLGCSTFPKCVNRLPISHLQTDTRTVTNGD